MSVLTKNDILERIKQGDIMFTPELDSFQLQRHAVDLRLGFTFLIPKDWHLTDNGRESLDVGHFDDPRPEHFSVVELEKGQFFEILPGEHLLASTLETIKISTDVTAILYPRSSTSRKGMSVDLTGVVDSGYECQLIIPIKNNTRSHVIRLFPGERLCQLVFQELSKPVTGRKSKYHTRDIIETFRKEKKEEVELIMKGEIRELKEKFKVE